jgi:2,3-bisphosphoglycerate-dependent phosphoglycerate mutase
VATRRLVLLRHGQSEWNARNLFTGWMNVPLTEAGEREAVQASRLLAAAHRLLPGLVHASVQRRAVRTAELALAECDRDWVPVRRPWRLNSNHYGALQGRNKAEVLAESSERYYVAWRRSYDGAPPALVDSSRYSQLADARYAVIPPEAPAAG